MRQSPIDAFLRAKARRAAALAQARRSDAARTAQLAFDFEAPASERAEASDVVVVPPLPAAPVAPEVQAYPVAPPVGETLADADDLEARRTSMEPKLRAITQAVADATRVPVEIVLTENRRTMISTRRREGTLVVRIHRIFLRAGPTVVHALARYLSRSDARASRLVGEFIEAQRHHVRPARPRTLRHEGHHHDLRSLFDEVNTAEFGGVIDGVSITWGKHGTSKRRRRSIRLGTYTRDEKLVRIHPALDASWVPRFFVRYIVFHELLHHVEPEIEHEGRTEFHTAKFRARERAYGEYRQALDWERENLNRLLSGSRG